MKEIMGETERGKRLISLIYDGILRIMNDEDYQDAIEKYSMELDDIADNTNDDQLLNDLNDIFDGKGISLSKDDLGDDEEDDEDFLNQFR
jgi:retron-type reverse transcriptase